jgi:hypothetical protein
MPNSIVYYSKVHAVYLDGLFARRGHNSPLSCPELARLLGVSFEARDRRWEDWPNDGAPSRTFLYPKTLAEVEAHFAAIDARERERLIEWHRSELARMEAEAATPITITR